MLPLILLKFKNKVMNTGIIMRVLVIQLFKVNERGQPPDYQPGTLEVIRTVAGFPGRPSQTGENESKT